MRPAIEVWRDAKEANAATYAECFLNTRRSPWADDADQAAAAVIEADRLALVAAIVKDLRKVGDDAVMKALFKTAANYIEAKFGGNNGDR